MNVHYLILVESDPPQLFLAAGNEERDKVTSCHFNYRISPIFPAKPGVDAPHLAEYPWIGFFTFSNPFQKLGELLAGAPAGFDDRLWFGYGLASVIIFASNRDELESLRDANLADLRASEVWHISNGIVADGAPWFASPASVNPQEFVIDFQLVHEDSDLQYLSREIAHGLSNLIPLAAQHSPRLLTLLKRLAAEVNGILAKLQGFWDSKAATNTERNQQRINSATDHLVQINSVLAYAHSQAFGGASPILVNRTFVHGHSLLGIGVAISALYAYANCVDAALATVPIYAVVRTTYRHAQAFNPFRNLQEIQLDQWSRQPDAIDRMLADYTGHSLDPRPHILFFSGRLGFQEAPYSISAAVQSLEFADTMRWSLTTLSHELMHSHVRLLLDAILADLTDANPGEPFVATYSEYEEFITRRGSPASLTRSIQFSIFNYCRFRLCTKELSSSLEKLVISDVLPEAVEMYNLLKEFYRDINEIIVHVLDFRYFYNSEITLYIDYLWQSWATVPSVLVDPEHYILRCLAVISTTLKGTLTERCKVAFDILSVRIDVLLPQIPGNVLLVKVRQILDMQSRRTLLQLDSLANQYLAEVTTHCLFSSAINTQLTEDDLLETNDEGESVYQLQASEFLQDAVRSPVSLLLDRVRHAASHNCYSEERQLSGQYRSAWLFLACASAQRE